MSTLFTEQKANRENQKLRINPKIRQIDPSAIPHAAQIYRLFAEAIDYYVNTPVR